jgi:hypothetical protein
MPCLRQCPHRGDGRIQMTIKQQNTHCPRRMKRLGKGMPRALNAMRVNSFPNHINACLNVVRHRQHFWLIHSLNTVGRAYCVSTIWAAKQLLSRNGSAPPPIETRTEGVWV